MRRLDESSADCLVYTFKDGLLSVVAHDLKIAVRHFTIDVDEDAHAIDARFDASSLRVVCAMRAGVESPAELTSDQKREIEGSIVRHVLAADAHPEIRYRSTAVADDEDGFHIHGQLTLHGTSEPVEVHVRREPGRYVATTRLQQPDFGIRPYSAMLGTLRVKAEVEVQVIVPFPPGHDPDRR